MRSATVRTIYRWIDSAAPFDSQEEYDNSGLLLGSQDATVGTVLLALDATPAVVREAAAAGAELIVAHHPLMFRPLRSLNEEEYEAAVISLLVRKRISLIAAHTNLDRTALSGSAAVAALLNLEKTRKEGAFLFLGELPFPLAAEALRGLTARLLGGPALLYGRRDALIRTLAVCGGACGDAYGQARAAGADALLTGEVRHHDAVAAAGSGFVLLSGGHFHTEAPMLPLLAAGLQKGMDELQYKVRIRVSESDPYVSFGLKEDE